MSSYLRATLRTRGIMGGSGKCRPRGSLPEEPEVQLSAGPTTPRTPTRSTSRLFSARKSPRTPAGGDREKSVPPERQGSTIASASGSSRKLGGDARDRSDTDHVLRWRDINLGRVIGVGASGAVHEADWNGSPVAVKVLHKKHLGPKDMEELADEAAMLLSLRHPNVISLYGACFEPTPTLVMALAPSGSRSEAGLAASSSRLTILQAEDAVDLRGRHTRAPHHPPWRRRQIGSCERGNKVAVPCYCTL